MNIYNFMNQYKAVTKSFLLAVPITLVVLDILLFKLILWLHCGTRLFLSFEAPGIGQSRSFVTHRQTNGLIGYSSFSDNFL